MKKKRVILWLGALALVCLLAVACEGKEIANEMCPVFLIGLAACVLLWVAPRNGGE
jgi:hypothetical protein